MIVCSCQGITSSEVEEAAASSGDSLVALLRELPACRGCGSCAPLLVELFSNLKESEVDKS